MRIAFVFLFAAGCTLDPLVEDDPRWSPHILPPGSEVPHVSEDVELVHQIEVHDGLDDGDLEEADYVVPRETARANGEEVHYWAFGNGTRISANAYLLVDGDQVLAFPWILDAMPGEPGYSPIRRIQHVQITDGYDGEVLPSVDALLDAIELGLVEEPVPTGTWVDAPIVIPGTRLEVGGGKPPLDPVQAYVDGWRVDLFRLGTYYGEQPLRSSPPTTQVSRMREGMSAGFTASPVFQMAIPTEPPGDRANWVPMAFVVEVRLAAGVAAADVVADAELFTRSGSGSITGYTTLVDSYTVTTTLQHWPVQLREGMP